MLRSVIRLCRLFMDSSGRLFRRSWRRSNSRFIHKDAYSFRYAKKHTLGVGDNLANKKKDTAALQQYLRPMDTERRRNSGYQHLKSGARQLREIART